MSTPFHAYWVNTGKRPLSDGWYEVPVEDLIQKYFSGPSPECEERQLKEDEEWGVLKTTAITWHGWNEGAHKVLPREYWSLQELALRKGDVLITKAGPRDRVGVVAHVTTNPRHLIPSGKMIVLRPRTATVLPQILAGVLSLRETQDFIQARTTGMAESQVNFENSVLLGATIKIPSMPEQIRIAEILDCVDSAISNTKRVVEKLTQVRIGLLHNLLNYGLDEHGQVRDPLRHPEQFRDSDVGRVPADWEILPFTALCTFPVGQVDPRHEPYRSWALIAPDHVEVGTGRLLKLEAASEQGAISGKYVCEPGDVIYSKIRPYLRKAVLTDRQCLCSADMYPLRPSERMNPQFLLLTILGESFSRFAVSMSERSGFPKINRNELKGSRLAIPPKPEQENIAKIAKTINDRMEQEVINLQKLLALKSGCSNDLLTGEVRVSSSASVSA